MNNTLPEDTPPEDTFKILIATDNHLGYGEKKPVIDQDSFRTFEEILKIGTKYEVDFVLLGGDLFHESQPSPYCIYKCTELLRSYSLGDKPISIEFLSDQSDNFQHLKNPVVNYEDPNLNVGIPIFSIHGNHDNLVGTKQISALDILAAQGLVNYFGRWTSLSEIEVRPLLFRKGKTNLALYGLSHIPDRRLARLLIDHKITWPKAENYECFNLLVLHQNRVNRGAKNFIPESALPKFMDLVVWGHEHDCLLTPDAREDFFISQPGSSVATSLSEGESFEKQVGILLVHGTTFQMVEIPLQTVRPFIFSSIELEHPESPTYDSKKPAKQSVNAVKEKIDAMISKAAEKHTDPDTNPPLPLLRLNVKYHNESQTFNTIRLGHEYENQVANPADIIKMSKIPKAKDGTGQRTGADFQADLEDMDEWATRVEDVVQKYFDSRTGHLQMSILSVKAMTEALSRYVDKNDTEAVNFAFDHQRNNILEKLIEKGPDEEELDKCIEDIRQEMLTDGNNELEKLLKALDDENRVISASKEPSIDIPSSDSDVEMIAVEKPAIGRGSRGARHARAAGNSSTRRASRAK